MKAKWNYLKKTRCFSCLCCRRKCTNWLNFSSALHIYTTQRKKIHKEMDSIQVDLPFANLVGIFPPILVTDLQRTCKSFVSLRLLIPLLMWPWTGQDLKTCWWNQGKGRGSNKIPQGTESSPCSSSPDVLEFSVCCLLPLLSLSLRCGQDSGDLLSPGSPPLESESLRTDLSVSAWVKSPEWHLNCK